ncbi:MAG: hypothetical protein MZV70_05885 [Desulfobacterales bacterium]|nr:hypothetical protein [Desulfobacterales bacterium]
MNHGRSSGAGGADDLAVRILVRGSGRTGPGPHDLPLVPLREALLAGPHQSPRASGTGSSWRRMGNFSMAEETGRPASRMVEYFAARAAGGAGAHNLRPRAGQPRHRSCGDGTRGAFYFPRIDRSRTNFAGWREIAARCREHGARVLHPAHAGPGPGRLPECLVTKRRLPVSASWNPNFYMPLVPCRPLTDGQLRSIVKRTGQAAADSKAAGIDGVYLHGHEGYLLEQMSNRAFNRRKLGAFADWKAFGTALVRGESEENRGRLPDHVPDRPVPGPGGDLRRADADRAAAPPLRRRAERRGDPRIPGGSDRGGGGPCGRGPGLLRQLVAPHPPGPMPPDATWTPHGS